MRSSPRSGLLSFAAVAQLAPAFFGGLIWRRGTALGALGGMSVGVLVWFYTLMLPSFADAGLIGKDLVMLGPFGLGPLRPQALLGVDLPPLVHGVFWSLALNVIVYIVLSFARAPTAIERLQASLFVPSELAPSAPSFRLWRSSVTVEELTGTVARYLGEERTRSSFESFASTRRISLDPQHEADVQLVRYAEHVLASAIGGSVLAARAFAAAAQADGLDQGRAQAARRCEHGDPVQSRDPANRARPCPAGHRGCSTRSCVSSAGTGSSARSSTCRSR